MNKYTAEPIVCDTGVFMNGELQLVCKHSKNAKIIAEIMNMDARDETADVGPVKHRFLTAEQVRSFSPAEVRENYNAILLSMPKWGEENRLENFEQNPIYRDFMKGIER